MATVATTLTFEEKHKTLYTRYTMTSAYNSIIPEFTSKIELLGLQNYFSINKTDIINTYSNNSILFRGIKTSSGNQSANLKSLEGISTWIVDEAEELVDEDIFDKINLSIREQGVHNRVILIMNPCTKNHWVYKRFFEDKGVAEGFNGIKGDTCYINTDYRDNIEFLSDSFLDYVKLIKEQNPNKFKHQILGSWLDVAEGVIFNNWSYGEFPEDVDYGYGLDFGFSNDPDAMTKIYVDNKAMKIYLHEEIYNNGLRTPVLIEKCKSICSDKTIVCDLAGDRIIADMKHAGLKAIPCKKGAGSVEAGIKDMQNYDIIVTPTSKNLVKEFNNYVMKNGSPIDMYNHQIDEIRYYLKHINKNKGRDGRQSYFG